LSESIVEHESKAVSTLTPTNKQSRDILQGFWTGVNRTVFTTEQKPNFGRFDCLSHRLLSRIHIQGIRISLPVMVMADRTAYTSARNHQTRSTSINSRSNAAAAVSGDSSDDEPYDHGKF
jgi:hypothetical protein